MPCNQWYHSLLWHYWHSHWLCCVPDSMKPAHVNSWLVTANARHYISARTTTTTPSVQTSPTARHHLSVHHLHSLHVPLAVVNTHETKQLLRWLSFTQHYYIKAAYNKTTTCIVLFLYGSYINILLHFVSFLQLPSVSIFVSTWKPLT